MDRFVRHPVGLRTTTASERPRRPSRPDCHINVMNQLASMSRRRDPQILLIDEWPARLARASRLVFDELSPREPRLDVVPVADALALAELPAKQDLATAAHRGKVDESLVRVLYVDAEMRDLQEERVDLPRDRVCRTPVV